MHLISSGRIVLIPWVLLTKLGDIAGDDIYHYDNATTSVSRRQ